METRQKLHSHTQVPVRNKIRRKGKYDFMKHMACVHNVHVSVQVPCRLVAWSLKGNLSSKQVSIKIALQRSLMQTLQRTLQHTPERKTVYLPFSVRDLTMAGAGPSAAPQAAPAPRVLVQGYAYNNLKVNDEDLERLDEFCEEFMCKARDVSVRHRDEYEVVDAGSFEEATSYLGSKNHAQMYAFHDVCSILTCVFTCSGCI